jgi:hypothetical protein
MLSSYFYAPLQALLVAAVAAGPVGWGQEVEKGEVLRRGDAVQVVEGNRWSDDGISDALAPPHDDSGKWHITIVKQQGCAPCATLIRDFNESPVLKAWVDTKDHKKSWAKYNVFDIDDASQAFRWKDVKVNRFPALIIQPPMDGRYGSPKTVVLHKYGYNGNPESLTREMRDGIVRYIEKLKQAPKRSELRRPSYVWGQDPIGVDPPFSPPPKVDPTQPEIPPQVNPNTPTPTVEPSGLPTTPTAYVSEAAKAKAGERVERFLENARERIKNLATIVLPADEAKKLFPGMDTANPPAVIVVDDGKVQEQVSLDSLPIDLTQLPWTDILTLIATLLTGTPVSWVLVGGIALKVFQVVRSRREAQGKRLFIPKALIDRVMDLLNSNKTQA